MKIKYDAEMDVLYIRFSDTEIDDSRETSEGYIVDLDVNGQAVGIEFLNASQRMPNPMHFEFSSVNIPTGLSPRPREKRELSAA